MWLRVSLISILGFFAIKDYKIAWETASYYGYQYQIIFAIHGDTKHEHIHFVMNTVNFVTGHKFGGDKADYFAYQKYLTTVLRQYGLDLVPLSDSAQECYINKNTTMPIMNIVAIFLSIKN